MEKVMPLTHPTTAQIMALLALLDSEDADAAREKEAKKRVA